MANVNKVILIGRLTRDPEVRYTTQKVPVGTLGLALNRTYTTREGEKREEATFVDVVVWQRLAEICKEYLKKGRTVYVEGRLTEDRWETREGQKRTKLRVTAEVVQFLDSRGGARGDAPPPEPPDEGLEAPPMPSGEPPPPPSGDAPPAPEEDTPF